MRVLVVGATGAIGGRLVRQLRERGHEVAGSSRSASRAGRLRELGAEPVVLDVLDLAVKTEDDPLLSDPPDGARETFGAMDHLDEAVTRAGGIALRYGGFYGDPDQLVEAVRKRRYPVVGDGAGVMSFVHLDDAAAAAVLALDHDGPAIYNVTDDEPAATRDWLPALAAAAGARPPRHVPTWVGRLIMGAGLDVMTGARGASNARAKQDLGWTLRYPSWRQGFRASYAALATIATGTRVSDLQCELPSACRLMTEITAGW